jgi:subtilisin-like proprotein convertase family protein
MTVNQDVLIGDLNVQINVTHTCDNDLYIHLRAPDGTDVVLVSRRGGTGDNFNYTVFDDEATRPISTGYAPFTGSYQPEMPLSAFDGKNARGTWQLWVEDQQYLDSGTLNSWSLIIGKGGASSSTITATSSVSGSGVQTASLPGPDADVVATKVTVPASPLAEFPFTGEVAGLLGNQEPAGQLPVDSESPQTRPSIDFRPDAHAIDVLFSQGVDHHSRVATLFTDERSVGREVAAFFEQAWLALDPLPLV